MDEKQRHAEICRTWSVLVREGDVHELRVPKLPRRNTHSGYFNAASAFIQSAMRQNGRAPIYMTINPCKPALLARSANRSRDYAAATTSDNDILCRRWLPIDLDAIRPAGISSSEEEHRAALQRSACCREWLLRQYGIPSIWADSGNGGHLLVPIDLPNDAASLTLVKRALAALSLRFDDEAVKVDQSCCNAARIWKVYGTVASKGDNTADRPHRYARLLEVPDDLSPVPVATLQRIATLVPEESIIANPCSGVTCSTPFDVEAFIQKHGLTVLRRGEWNGAQRWLIVCPFDADHSDNSAIIVRFPSGRLGFRCQHNSCTGRDWQALRSLLEPDRMPKEPAADRQTGAAQGFISSISFFSYPNGNTAPLLQSPPSALDEAAYHGLAGEFVRTIEPHTESDPVAILAQFLIAFGNVIGRKPYFQIEANRHYMNLFGVLVGQSAKGRKGTSRDHVLAAFREVDEGWADSCVQSGLSSGEGLIHAVRDSLEREEPIKDRDKKVIGYQTVVVDPGVADKRLFVTESEFARTLKVMDREGNTLSALLRDAWDTGKLRVLTKSPEKATGAHISIAAHITREELNRYLTNTEAANGFGNRFLWFYVQRARLLPDGGALHTVDLHPLYQGIARAVRFASGVERMERDEEARQAWHAVYPELSREEGGLIGSLTARAEAQALRLSCLYALLDCSPVVRLPHLKAALAVWTYAEESARYIFGGGTGDPIADTILQALRSHPDGLTRTDISRLFALNYKADRIQRALDLLAERQLAWCERVEQEGKGRAAEVWRAASP